MEGLVKHMATQKWTSGEKLCQGTDLQRSAGLAPMQDLQRGLVPFCWGISPRPSPELHHATEQCKNVSLPCPHQLPTFARGLLSNSQLFVQP